MTFMTDLRPENAAASSASASRPLVDLKFTWIATAAICAFFVCARGYEQMFGVSTGMDSFSAEFQMSWMLVLYIFTTAEAIAFLAVIYYIWKTRDLDVANVEPREETRRVFHLLGWLFVYGAAFYWGASFFGEQDAAWHQTFVRDSAFTPVNIIKYYVADAIFIITGIGGFMYARTRLPTFACKGWSIAFVLLFIGPLMLLPCAGLSEWGRTCWIMEELFVAPMHWGFVFFGWFSLAAFGVARLVFGRLAELCSGYEDLLGLSAAD
jgi:methane/ammonia monooxygenase subunit C